MNNPSCDNCKYQRKIVLNKRVHPACILAIPEITKKCTYVSGYELIQRYGQERVNKLLNNFKANCQEYIEKEIEY